MIHEKSTTVKQTRFLSLKTSVLTSSGKNSVGSKYKRTRVLGKHRLRHRDLEIKQVQEL